MRMLLIFAMMLSVIWMVVKWRYKIWNSLLNWKQGRKLLVPLIGKMILRKREKEAV